MAQNTLREVRLLIYELRPSELEEEGLIGALYRRLETVEQRSGIEARLHITDEAGGGIISGRARGVRPSLISIVCRPASNWASIASPRRR